MTRFIKPQDKVLLITDKMLVKLGLAKRVTDIIDGIGAKVEIYDDVPANPHADSVNASFAIAKAMNATTIVCLGGGKALSSNRSKAARQEPQRINLLMDIQAKLQAGKGPGYERWAKVFNLKQMAQTLNFLAENNLLEYAELEKNAASASARFNELSARIKAVETRMAEIGNLKAHIINYSKTRDVYIAYRKAGYSKIFYEAHMADILLHKAAKAVFDALPRKKIPTIKALQAEYETRLSEKKKAYFEYTAFRKEMKELFTAKANINRLLGDAREQTEKSREQTEKSREQDR